MKKNHLYLASALLSVLLISGIAQSNAAEATKPTATKTMEAVSGKMPMKGMPDGPRMSEETRKAMHDAMMKVHEDNKGLIDEIQAKHKELQEIVKAPAFDKAAFLDKKEEIQTLHHKMGKARIEAMADVIEKLSPEERAKMGEMHGRHMMGGMGKMGKGEGKWRDCPMMEDGEDGAMAPMKGMMDGKGPAPATPTKK